MALASSETALKFGIEPKVAMLSYSTRGSGSGGMVDKVRNATKLAQEMLQSEEYKNLPIIIDGEMQADAALDSVVARKKSAGFASRRSGKRPDFPLFGSRQHQLQAAAASLRMRSLRSDAAGLKCTGQ